MSDTGLLKKESGVCPICKKKFKKVTKHQVFDLPKCRRKHWELMHPRMNMDTQSTANTAENQQ